MKITHKAALFVGFAGIVALPSACTDYLDVNTNPNAPQIVTANLYLPAMEHWMVTAPQYDGRYVGGYTQEWISTSGTRNGVGLTYQEAWGRMGYDPGSDNGALKSKVLFNAAVRF